MKIIIFSREIHSGKTTELFVFCKNRRDICGILMPNHNNGKYFYSIATKTDFGKLAKNDKDLDVVKVGNYEFLKQDFDAANQIILHSVTENYSYLIIDEIGKLELLKKGFYSSLKKILLNNLLKPNLTLILVIREGIINEVISFFKIKEFTVISSLVELN